MVIAAYLECHNCNNGWKAGGMPVLPFLAAGHSVSPTVCVHVKIPLKGVGSVAALPAQTSIHPLELSTALNADIYISVEISCTDIETTTCKYDETYILYTH